MAGRLFTTIATLSLFWIVLEAYGNGAPHGACHDLEPQHYGVIPMNPKQFPNPYSIETLYGSYLFTPGHETQFRLHGQHFRGFIFQVRDELGRSRGKFSSLTMDAKTLTCRHPDDTITHTSPEIKSDVIFTWKAPDNARHKVLYLRGTIVESENSFWSDKVIVLYSSILSHEFENEREKPDL